MSDGGQGGRQPGHMHPFKGQGDTERVEQKWNGWADHYAFETFSVDASGTRACPVHDLAAIAPYVHLALSEDALKANQAFADRYSVDRECRHGWLPTDRKCDCSCWREPPSPG